MIRRIALLSPRSPFAACAVRRPKPRRVDMTPSPPPPRHRPCEPWRRFLTSARRACPPSCGDRATAASPPRIRGHAGQIGCGEPSSRRCRDSRANPGTTTADLHPAQAHRRRPRHRSIRAQRASSNAPQRAQSSGRHPQGGDQLRQRQQAATRSSMRCTRWPSPIRAKRRSRQGPRETSARRFPSATNRRSCSLGKKRASTSRPWKGLHARRRDGLGPVHALQLPRVCGGWRW